MGNDRRSDDEITMRDKSAITMRDAIPDTRYKRRRQQRRGIDARKDPRRQKTGDSQGAEFFINSVCERGRFLEYLGRETSLRFLGGRTFFVSFPYFSILSKLDRCNLERHLARDRKIINHDRHRLAMRWRSEGAELASRWRSD
jgi:hypothetical protein